MLPEGGCIFSVIFPPVYCLASPAFLWLLWLFGFSGFCGLLASVAFWLSAPRVFSAGDVDFNADDQAAGVDDAVAVDRNDAELVPMHNPKQLELLRAAYTPEHWEKICEGSDSEDSLDEARYTNRVTHASSFRTVFP